MKRKSPLPVSAANVASHLSHMAAEAPGQLAIACAARGRWPWQQRFAELSFRELDDWSSAFARGLNAHGIGKGARVLLLVPPGPEFFASVFALMKAGAVMVCIDPGIGIGALGRCIREARPQAFIGSPRAHLARRLFGWARHGNRLNIYTGTHGAQSAPYGCHGQSVECLQSLLEQEGVLSGKTVRSRDAAPEPTRMYSRRVLIDSTPSCPPPPPAASSTCTLSEIAAEGLDAGDTLLAETLEADPAAILFTSGSTGPPKGVVYSHGTFQAQIQMLRETYAITPGEVDLSTFPLFALFAPALGMSAVIPKMDFTRPARARPQNIISAVNRYGVTSLFGSPALLRRLGQWNRRYPHSLPTLRRVISAGAPVPAQVLEDLVPMLPLDARIHTPFGATEILPVSSIDSTEILGDTAAATAQGHGVCVGRPIPGVQVRILALHPDPVANAGPEWLETGAVGEIAASGPNLSLGYDGRDNAQRQVRFRDAGGREWHRMGDCGYFDVRGRLWFCGRLAHCVTTREGIHYPIPCEGIFNAHPLVQRSALVRLDTAAGALAGLCVELELSAPMNSRERIRAELLELGAAHAHTRGIREIFFHPSFPVDIRHNAKIDRERLGAWATAIRA